MSDILSLLGPEALFDAPGEDYVPPPVEAPVPAPQPEPLPPMNDAGDANPAPRFEPPAEQPRGAPWAGILRGRGPLRGIMPSEEVRIRRMGMMQAGAALAQAADSGQSFAVGITQALLAGNIAAEQMREQFVAQRMNELQQIASMKQETPARGPIDWSDDSREGLMEEAQRHEQLGWHESSSDIRAWLNDRYPVYEPDVVQQLREDGRYYNELWNYSGEEPRMIKTMGVAEGRQPIDPSLIKEYWLDPETYKYFRLDTNDFVSDMEFKTYDGMPDPKDLAAQQFAYGQDRLQFKRDVMAGGEWVQNQHVARQNIMSLNERPSLAKLSGYLRAEDPSLADHQMLYTYLRNLDNSVVKAGEVSMLESIGSYLELGEHWFAKAKNGSALTPKIRFAMVLAARMLTERVLKGMELEHQSWDKMADLSGITEEEKPLVNPNFSLDYRGNSLYGLLDSMDDEIKIYLHERETDPEFLASVTDMLGGHTVEAYERRIAEFQHHIGDRFHKPQERDVSYIENSPQTGFPSTIN